MGQVIQFHTAAPFTHVSDAEADAAYRAEVAARQARTKADMDRWTEQYRQRMEQDAEHADLRDGLDDDHWPYGWWLIPCAVLGGFCWWGGIVAVRWLVEAIMQRGVWL